MPTSPPPHLEGAYLRQPTLSALVFVELAVEGARLAGRPFSMTLTSREPSSLRRSTASWPHGGDRRPLRRD